MATVVLQPADAIEEWRPGEQNQLAYHGETVETLLDGSFTMQRVAPGSYYVIATQRGYISPLALLYIPGREQAAAEPGSEPAPESGPESSGAPGLPKRIPGTAPRITVQSGLPVNVTVSIERGAAVSGTALFDDGSPASGLRVSLLVRLKGKWIPITSLPFEGASYSAQTDDQGYYRISGLPPREYLLEVVLNRSRSTFSVDKANGMSMSMNSIYSLSFYSGGKTRQADAVPFTLSAGEERHGEDIEIPVSKLHVVRGTIISARDGHVVNGGQLSLLYADDKSAAGHTALSSDDEVFTFSFVPDGDYLVHVDAASDNDYVEKPNPPHSPSPTTTETHTLRSYGSVDHPVHVSSDVTGILVAVPDLPEQANRPKP